MHHRTPYNIHTHTHTHTHGLPFLPLPVTLCPEEPHRVEVLVDEGGDEAVTDGARDVDHGGAVIHAADAGVGVVGEGRVPAAAVLGV